MGYELLEHTADIRIRVKGMDLPDLFAQAGLAVFEIMAERLPGKPPRLAAMRVKASGWNLDELFINWLNELLSLAYARAVVFTGFEGLEFHDSSLSVQAVVLPMKHFRINTEIKAATYHDLVIREAASGGWVAEVIFDV